MIILTEREGEGGLGVIVGLVSLTASIPCHCCSQRRLTNFGAGASRAEKKKKRKKKKREKKKRKKKDEEKTKKRYKKRNSDRCISPERSWGPTRSPRRRIIHLSLSLSLSLYIYIYMCVCIYIYICIYRSCHILPFQPIL